MLLLSLIWKTHLMDDECNDLDKVVEDINEIIRLVSTQHRDSLARLSKKRATFDGNIDDKIITITLDKYSMLSCVDMNWFYKHLK